MPKTLIEQVRKHNAAMRKAHANNCCSDDCSLCLAIDIADQHFEAVAKQFLIRKMERKANPLM